MKRISISAIVLLVVTAGAAEARYVYRTGYGYGSSRTRVRWSMYAHGLISGDLYYSPYASGHGDSGLVDGHVRYSPYAFGGGHSGLVSEEGVSYSYGFTPAYFHVIHHPVSPAFALQSSKTPDSQRHESILLAQRNRRETAEDRKACRAAQAKAREERNAIRANDGKEIIAEYLRAKKIDFKTTRILGISGKTVSVDFLLNDGKTILKYWNPEAIPSEGQQRQRQRQCFEKYLESWAVACAEHLRAGGDVHQIISSDREEILAQLPQCPNLNGVEKVYAVAQSETSTAEIP